MTIYHIKPGKYEEAEAFGKKTKALNAKKKYGGSYFVEERIIGKDTPAFIVGTVVKDKASFLAEEKKLQKTQIERLDVLPRKKSFSLEFL